MSDFDAAAPTFEHYRALPSGVPEAIRAAAWEAVGWPTCERVLDLGAGTGRVGRAFTAADDLYFGVDSSMGMLREFASQQAAARLIQTDGEHLPFGAACFGVVLLIHALSGVSHWRRLVSEAQRVLRPGGALVVGQTIAPDMGVDTQMKRHLAALLEDLGVGEMGSEKGWTSALSWLQSAAARTQRVVAASWIWSRTPRRFLEHHRTGHRFSALPLSTQEKALQQLSAWAESKFGSLDATFSEPYVFELHVFQW
jgi:ubiquinone/menaquinone biosynthesis C-methylase UbiE